MYKQIGIQKLSHNQILKLLRGERIRVKHGNGHEIHASVEQHKKIMAAHKKGKGVTIQLDPYQCQMHEHHALKGKGFIGDLAKRAFKHVAPHVVDWAGHELKRGIEGMGEEGEGLHFANHVHSKFHAKRPVAVKKTAKQNHKLAKEHASKLFDESVEKMAAHLSHQHAGGALYPAGYKEHDHGMGVHHHVAPKRRGRPRKVGGNILSPTNLQHISQQYPNLNEAQVKAFARSNNQHFIENHPNFYQNHPVIAKLKGKGFKGKSANPISTIIDNLPPNAQNAIDRGLTTIFRPLVGNRNLIPNRTRPNLPVSQSVVAGQNFQDSFKNDWNAGFRNITPHSSPLEVSNPSSMFKSPLLSQGGGIHHKKKCCGKKKGCGHKKKGEGVLGALLGKTLGGVAGRAFGGKKHGQEGHDVGSILGGIAGDFLPF